MEQRSNALRVQPPRFQLPRTLQEGFSPNEVIHSFCNILFESWIHPNTREYSYHIISLDNFGRIFHRSWNSLTKFNHPPRIVQTFTLALEKDMFIVLKYSAGYKVERFLVLTQPLIKFIADLHKKQTEKRNDINNKEIQLPSLIVKINRKSLPKQFIDNIENSYGITYGPSLQQLFECYLLPEMEKPYMLLGHALTLNAIKDLVTEYQIDAVRQNLMYSKFVRASDVEPSSETESEESETDQEIESLKKVQTQTTTLPATNTLIQTPQTQNVDRMSSPFEADVPSSINRKQSLSKWSDEYCQESANLGREDARLPNKEQNKQEPKNNEVEKNRINKRHQIIEQVSKPLQPDVRENLNELDEDIVDMGPLDLCCGLDSRYCRCYRLKGYIPRTLNYELVCIKFSSLSTDSWRVTFEKYSYDSAYDDLYKTGNIMRSRDAGNNAVQMSLADAVEQYGEEILNNKYMAAIPCKLFRMWQQNELQADNDAKFLMVRLGDKNHLSKLGILDTAAVVFRQNEFQRILSQFTTFFACSEGDDNALEKRSEGEPDYEEDIRSVEVIIEPDLPDFITDSEGK
ncbi:unnamed protein product [Hermetia illucens]|uniref:Uncharacterized protein n=1 Tax=Hermetia illucens TaxID=343691 RepID=A0A7R8UI81_HERIL|nr:unnamed protein product [Hermetia illucens]